MMREPTQRTFVSGKRAGKGDTVDFGSIGAKIYGVPFSLFCEVLGCLIDPALDSAGVEEERRGAMTTMLGP